MKKNIILYATCVAVMACLPIWESRCRKWSRFSIGPSPQKKTFAGYSREKNPAGSLSQALHAATSAISHLAKTWTITQAES